MQTEDNLTIRPVASAEDIDSAAKLMLDLHRIHVQNRPDVYADVDESVLRNLIAPMTDSSENIALIAECEGTPAGMCLLSIKNPVNPLLIARRLAVIEAIYVRDDLRLHGIGSKLYRTAVETAKRSGVESLQLSVYAFNQSARSFYDSMGMKVKSSTLEIAM